MTESYGALGAPASITSATHTFDVYGYHFSIRSSARDSRTAEELVEGIREDFAFFARGSGASGITIELFHEAPPIDQVPHTDATVYTPRNVAYRDKKARYIDYHGRALGIQEFATGNFRLYSTEADLLYEATYLYLLSQIGQHLDRRGLHRIHALGVAVNDRAVLVLLPMGGGKSTLGLDLLKNPAVRILSDDSPFIDRSGRILSYPLRLGLLPGSEEAVPPQHRRLIRRMEFGPKYLANYSYFKDRVSASAPPGFVFLGARTLAPECRIDKIRLDVALRACIANCVVGMGLFQGLEFILQASGLELVNKSGIAASRMWNCWQLLRRSQLCRIHLGRDRDLNARTLFDYVSG